MSIIEKVMDKLEMADQSDPQSQRVKHIDNKDNKDNASAATGEISVEHQSQADNAGLTKTSQLVEFDFESLEKSGIMTPDSINITLSEQYRRIKMPILQNAFGADGLATENRNMVMVTSSIQGEGKSFTSFNLAMSIAKEFNHTVLYIDADVTQKMLNKFAGVGEKAGLVDFLLDEKQELADLLLKTNIQGLTLLPSGRSYDRITEMWASQRMNDLMRELSKRYSDRLVIFDAPPILQESSASILARLVGQIIVVVEAEKTPRHIVEEALTMINDSQFVGLILNKSNQRDVAEYGYYGSD